MIMNKEGKLFGKISIIDVLVIVAVIVIGIGFYLRFFGDSRVITTNVELEYVIRVHSVRPTSVGALQRTAQIEGVIFDPRTDEELGRVIQVRDEPTYWEAALLDGNWISGFVPGRFNAYVTVRVDGRVNETGYFTFENRSIAIGNHVAFQSRYSDTSGEIIAIQIIDDVRSDSE